MDEQSTFHRLQQRLVAILDKLLSVKGWDDSPLLKVYQKRLRALRQKAEDLAPSTESEHLPTTTEEPSIPSGHRLVYISLFQADGSNLIKWEMAIRSLETLFLGRAIHDNQESAEKLINAKPNKVQEGYVVVMVKDSDILAMPSGRQMYDMLHQKLIVLKQKAINADNIIGFVHGNALRYRLVDNRLVLVSAQ